jgi:hypothetical protein
MEVVSRHRLRSPARSGLALGATRILQLKEKQGNRRFPDITGVPFGIGRQQAGHPAIRSIVFAPDLISAVPEARAPREKASEICRFVI